MEEINTKAKKLIAKVPFEKIKVKEEIKEEATDPDDSSPTIGDTKQEYRNWKSNWEKTLRQGAKEGKWTFNGTRKAREFGKDHEEKWTYGRTQNLDETQV